MTFSGGLAAGGARPVCAIYATFMQRALDCVYHDVVLQKLPVIFALDRAGAVEDGPTHHGIYDLGFLRALPGLLVMAPKNEAELAKMLFFAYEAGNRRRSATRAAGLPPTRRRNRRRSGRGAPKSSKPATAP